MNLRALAAAPILLSLFVVACTGSSTDDSGSSEGAFSTGADASTPPDASSAPVDPAKLQVFSCKTDRPVDGDVTTLDFSVRNITDNSNIELLDPNGQEDEDYMPLKASPENRLLSLNENMSIYADERGIGINGDSAGVFLVDLYLYANSGYTAGYVRVRDNGGGDDHAYSTIRCTRTER